MSTHINGEEYGSGYASLAEYLIHFKSLATYRVPLDIYIIDDGDSIRLC